MVSPHVDYGLHTITIANGEENGNITGSNIINRSIENRQFDNRLQSEIIRDTFFYNSDYLEEVFKYVDEKGNTIICNKKEVDEQHAIMKQNAFENKANNEILDGYAEEDKKARLQLQNRDSSLYSDTCYHHMCAYETPPANNAKLGVQSEKTEFKTEEVDCRICLANAGSQIVRPVKLNCLRQCIFCKNCIETWGKKKGIDLNTGNSFHHMVTTNVPLVLGSGYQEVSSYRQGDKSIKCPSCLNEGN